MAPKDSKSATAAPAQRIKVRATRMGYYDHIRRREGDVFVIAGEQQFSTEWMERVSGNTPERVSTGQDDLRRQHKEIMDAKTPGALPNVPNDPTGDTDVI